MHRVSLNLLPQRYQQHLLVNGVLSAARYVKGTPEHTSRVLVFARDRILVSLKTLAKTLPGEVGQTLAARLLCQDNFLASGAAVEKPRVACSLPDIQ